MVNGVAFDVKGVLGKVRKKESGAIQYLQLGVNIQSFWATIDKALVPDYLLPIKAKNCTKLGSNKPLQADEPHCSFDGHLLFLPFPLCVIEEPPRS